MSITLHAELEQLTKLGEVSDPKEVPPCEPFSSQSPFPIDPAICFEAVEIADALIEGTPIGEEIIDFSKPILLPTAEEWRTIPLTRGQEAKVDAADYEAINSFKWHCTDTGYAARMGSNKGVYMHRQILGLTDPTIHADHINGDKLDNRRSNLRACSQLENNRNTTKRNIQTTSDYKGVSWDAVRGKWRASIVVNRRQISERHDTELAAAKRYNELALEHHGNFASFNEIPGECPDCWESLDEYERCSGCEYGHSDCDAQDCFACFERAVDRAERMAEGMER